MAKKVSAYVDTSAFIAFLDRSDTYSSLFARLFSDPPHLVTSSLVIAEGHAWFLRRYDVTRSLQFLEFIESLKPLTVRGVGINEIKAGARFCRKYSDQNLTLADAVGLHLMAEHKIRSCWSTDRHLNLTGVPIAIYQTD